MRNTPNVKAERYRYSGPPGTNSGAFIIDPTPRFHQKICVVAGDGMGWDHVSVSLATRCPTWEEMCFVKELFFKDDECVMQLHPPKSENISFHPFCLHLWRPQTPEEVEAIVKEWTAEDHELSRMLKDGFVEWKSPGVIPRPPGFMVGPQADQQMQLSGG
jgi:hypothetical protein